MAAWSIATRGKLLAWYRRNGRDLPWRRTKDPYAIWVSEVMLQQTRVASVVPYYGRFLQRFPDVESLARARLDTVLARWSGLGYYRRARYMHEAARIMRRDGLPRTLEGWRALPGVGAYTAAAVASIAFGIPAAVVDGNVERVLCRLHARETRDVNELAQEWIDPRLPAHHNQAVMELGATVCTPRSPDCSSCPLRTHCKGRAAPAQYPAPQVQGRTVLEEKAVRYVVRDGEVLLRRSRGLNEGLWDLPPGRGHGERLGTVRHGVLDRRQRIHVHRGRPGGDGRWFTSKQIARIPLAASARKCLLEVGFLPDNRRQT